ncbi:MAG: radical SAM protein, partial [Caldilineae bacterium]
LPFVEDRAPLPDAAVDALFGPELAQVAAEKPDLVGFSILAEQNLLYALALGRAIKERFGIPIALGGAMMSHLRPQELLQGFPWLDFVFFGEAELSIVKFVEAWPDQDWEDVPGLAHRDGRRVCVHERPPQLPLDALAYPDFSDFPLQEYIVPEPVLPIITCRGCYWGKCTFCSHTLPYGGGVRMRRADRVIEEMAHQMKRYGVRNFLFVDEAISPAMLRRLSQGILERGLDVLFGAEGVRVERAFDRELLELAHRAGLRWIYVGIESSVQRLLDLIEKGIQIETILRLIEDCAEVGITPQLSFIVGLPGTTQEELAQEIAFMQRFPVDSSSYVLLAGSPMFDRRRELGLRVEDQQVLYRTPRGPVHAPRYFFTVEQGLSPVQADALVEAAGPRPRMRPHLGEVHAVLLADTDFFTSMERPPDPPLGPAAALEQLAAWPEDARDGRWFLHMVGCLEEEGRFQEA